MACRFRPAASADYSSGTTCVPSTSICDGWEARPQSVSWSSQISRVRLRERFNPEFRGRHIEAPHPSSGGRRHLPRQHLKRHQQGIAAYLHQFSFEMCTVPSSISRGLPVTAVHVMNGDVLLILMPKARRSTCRSLTIVAYSAVDPKTAPLQAFPQFEAVEQRTTRA